MVSVSRLVRLSAILVCVLVAAPAVRAQYFGQNKVQYRRFDFRVLQTTHFDIYYYTAEEEAAYHAARMAERWYAHLSRVLEHELHDRQPIVLYASHPEFAQTNVIAGSPGEATRGFTEASKNRVVLPFGASLADTNHVLGHELVHAFQYDVARHGSSSILDMPLWFTEGMAEYVSVGGVDGQTAMWMRDAVSRNDVPTVKQMADARYFPYRYGQAFWTYLAGRFGEGVVPRLLKATSDKVERRLKDVTGITAEQLSAEWCNELRRQYPVAAQAKGPNTGATADPRETLASRQVVTAKSGGRLNVGPSLSPDGREMVFLSEKDRFSVDMFVADTASGVVKRKIISTATDPHFDSLEFIGSAGAWDPTGRQFAFTGVREGHGVLVIVEAQTGRIEREVPLGDIGQAFNPTWSPDGTRIAFSGLTGGMSDLYVYDLNAASLSALTRDIFSDIQPSWSPDGRTIAFVTDRFSTDIRLLEFGSARLAALDVATGAIRELPGLARGRNQDPHWSPDGRSIFFVASPDGIPNVYRLEIGPSTIARVTDLWNGLSGVTAISPALSVAADRLQIAFSVYYDGGFEIHALEEPAELAGQPVDLASTTLPGARSVVETPPAAVPLVETPVASLGDVAVKQYRKGMALDRIVQPYFSTAGGSFGGFVQAGMGVSFGDMLRDQQVDVAMQVGKRRDDFAALVTYLNRSSRLNYGVSASFVPVLYARSESLAPGPEGTAMRRTDYLRQIHTAASGLMVYPFNRARRLEFRGGFERVTFARETDLRELVTASGTEIRHDKSTVRTADPLVYAQTSAAFVQDTAVLGPTSPILGTRARFELAPAMGGVSFTTLLADYRRYMVPAKPFTIAVRTRYLSRFGPDASDPRLLPLVWTLRDQVRGYDLTRLLSGPCSNNSAAGCSVDLLSGSRLFIGNVELRFPIPGVVHRSYTYGLLPMEGFVFFDGGSLWTRTGQADETTWSRHTLRSAGAGLRVRAGGLVLEAAAVRPYDRTDKRGWTLSFILKPGF